MDALQACNGDTSNAWIDVVGGLSPTRTLTGFWGNFRMAGHSAGTRTVGVSPFGLVDECIGDEA
jgi:hypothetical protein